MQSIESGFIWSIVESYGMETAHYVAGDKEQIERGREGCVLSSVELTGPSSRLIFPPRRLPAVWRPCAFDLKQKWVHRHRGFSISIPV